ncbi:MAG: response regulator [Planctomycetota bacterium]|jgi:CheY-like chemotaxis protein
MNKKLQILLVDASNGDAQVIKDLLKNHVSQSDIVHVETGSDAINFLTQNNHWNHSIVIVDLNLPDIKGADFLKKVKSDKELRKVPIVVLSRSWNEINESFAYGAAGYMTKPIDHNEFKIKIETIIKYWTLCELPQDKHINSYTQ